LRGERNRESESRAERRRRERGQAKARKLVLTAFMVGFIVAGIAVAVMVWQPWEATKKLTGDEAATLVMQSSFGPDISDCAATDYDEAGRVWHVQCSERNFLVYEETRGVLGVPPDGIAYQQIHIIDGEPAPGEP
jgi:hypothetical protein